jgi:type I restriction enzyme S subunit
LVEQNKSRKDSGETGSELLKKIKAEKAKLIAEGKLKKEKPLPPIKPEEIPFEIPENWVWCRLGEILELISGQDLVPSEYNENKESGIPYITGASNLEKGEVILNRWTSKPRAFALKGDLLLTCKGSGVGKIAIFNEKEAHIARQIMSIRSKWLPIEFIRIFLELQTENFRKQAKSLIPGIDRGTVLTLIFPLPPSAEQNRIIQMVSELMKFCDQLEASIKESQEQNEKLLQQVLREALRKEEVKK